ncbi:M14 family zinc carboxypeptidase [Rhodanobacter thiooxydans]|uniref:M14 family zinc carboxypeptidase n=1 Tax=Rhodanobacter thiooxydans TaxID=416169 RepID=UPI000260E2FB|nr:M14 family zinc carboxypeptidase [Rhodanobacter thiooxydans]EIL97412.1 putative lipoprotein [Rhodanobacter thiooxydans LCS2]MCW0201860.1 M14 family zinc carboxypeptidase [Rhodanobacter thiooxydans]
MHAPIRLLLAVLLASGSLGTFAATGPDSSKPYARDPAQPVDLAYTAQILKFTTDHSFNSPLTDYLPASASVPTPDRVLGHIAGAPDYLPHVADVHRYFRALAAASPRVKVFSIGKSEEGREMIAVAIADENLLADLDANKERLAKLADPRRIGMDDAVADQLVAQSTPVYYITGAIHSTETGSPTALMELAYRLAVDEAPYIQRIRSHVITLITPVVEVDGRDRMADLYNWHLAHPGQNYPRLLYWGHYVAHDNNRDAMGMSLNLTRNVADTFVGWHAQVLHDLHESVPFLYDNTVGDGPYNAWIDPILTGEWQQLGWDNVQQMTRLGMPGVFTHGGFDTWSPGYLMFIAAMHNGISRLYETYGNAGADTVQRILEPSEYERTWYRPNPPLPTVLWSQRNNNNYQQTGLLTALNYFAGNGQQFLKNFYLKAKRSIEKPQQAGPAAYVFPADDKRPGSRAQLLRILQLQHTEISRTTSPVTVTLPKQGDDKKKAKTRTFPAGSYVVRMDQPYSRIADTLLDRQYWSPKDPQQHPYDDTGWSMGDLFDVQVVRVTDTAILKAPMRLLDEPVAVPQGLAALDMPQAKLPRIALMHTWLSTQTEGWWRMALDKLGVPYDYISTQDVAKGGDLRAKYDVILFGPVGDASTQRIVDGLPMWGKPLPWKTTALTPNLGRIDATDDIRPGLGESGVANLKRFVQAGGLLITAEDTAKFAIDVGLAPGVFVTKTDKLKVVGSVLQAKFADRGSPIAAGYGRDELALYSAAGQSFTVSNLVTGDKGLPTAKEFQRPTGRGGPHDTDTPEGRASIAPASLPDIKPWQPLPLNAEQMRNNPWVIPADQRPRVILRYAEAKNLLISGLLAGGDEMAERAAVVDARYGKGHVLLFASNPIWRGETIGSYPLVLNAIVNFDKLDTPPAKP